MSLWLCGVIVFLFCDRIVKSLMLSQKGAFFLFHEPFSFTEFSSSAILFLLFLFFLCVELIIFFQYYKSNAKYLYSIYFVAVHALLSAGVLSNLFDRFLYGGVLDIFSVPRLVIFNLADIFIVCGGFGIFYFLTFRK